LKGKEENVGGLSESGMKRRTMTGIRGKEEKKVGG
jgi:hypothetical protein